MWNQLAQPAASGNVFDSIMLERLWYSSLDRTDAYPIVTDEVTYLLVFDRKRPSGNREGSVKGKTSETKISDAHERQMMRHNGLGSSSFSICPLSLFIVVKSMLLRCGRPSVLTKPGHRGDD